MFRVHCPTIILDRRIRKYGYITVDHASDHFDLVIYADPRPNNVVVKILKSSIHSLKYCPQHNSRWGCFGLNIEAFDQVINDLFPIGDEDLAPSCELPAGAEKYSMDAFIVICVLGDITNVLRTIASSINHPVTIEVIDSNGYDMFKAIAFNSQRLPKKISGPPPATESKQSSSHTVAPVKSQNTALAKLPTNQRRPIFRDGSYFAVIPTDHMIERLRERVFLSDTIVDFCMDYLGKNVFTDEIRENTLILGSFEFSRLKRIQDSRGLLFQSESYDPICSTWCALFDSIYNRLKPATMENLAKMLSRKLIILPVFWTNHWFLVMIVGIMDCSIDEYLDNFESFVENFDIGTDISKVNGGSSHPQSSQKNAGRVRKEKTCKIVFMDSKINDQVNIEIVKHIHDIAYRIIKQWIKAVYWKLGGGTVPTEQFTQIRCHNLPQQPNDADCGLYLFRYAEYFASTNRKWMEFDEDDMRNLAPDDPEQFQKVVAGSRTWIRKTIDKLSGF